MQGAMPSRGRIYRPASVNSGTDRALPVINLTLSLLLSSPWYTARCAAGSAAR
jgi:hypothetical protein